MAKKNEVVETKVENAEVVNDEQKVAVTIRDCEVLKHMVLTEKTQDLTKNQNVLTLNVDVNAKASEVKHAVENYFNVKVDDVRILNVAGRSRTVGRFKGKTARTRKAYVKVNKSTNLVEMANEAQQN